MSGFIALPSGAPGGMEAPLDAHFGHCQVYTLVEVEDGQVKNTSLLPSIPHEQGGCMAPVNHLAQNNVTCLISGGMGMRPLQGFGQVGIDVYYSGGLRTVGEAVNAFLEGKLQSFTPSQTCGGQRLRGISHETCRSVPTIRRDGRKPKVSGGPGPYAL